MNSSLKNLVEERLSLQSNQRQLQFSFGLNSLTWQHLNSPAFKVQYQSWGTPKQEEFLTLLGGQRNKQQLKGIIES